MYELKIHLVEELSKLKDVTVNAITQEQFGAKAQRPKDARMNTSKFERTFNIKLPLWQDYLEETMRG